MEPSFTLIGSDGQPHAYTVVLHNVEEGLPIVDALLRAGLPAFGTTIGALLTREGGGAALRKLAGSDTSGADGGDTADTAGADAALEVLGLALQTLDFGQLGQRLADALPAMKVAELAPRLLARTSRDGKDLGNPANFNAAYRGNYGELSQAAWKVVGINGFFPRLGT